MFTISLVHIQGRIHKRMFRFGSVLSIVKVERRRQAGNCNYARFLNRYFMKN
jgi:hypothetical protein